MKMAHLKVISPSDLPLRELLGPLPVEGAMLKIPGEEARDRVAKAIIRGHLEDGIRSLQNTSMILPPCLLDTIADSVIQLAKDEPCGLRGSALEVIFVEERQRIETTSLVRIKADPSFPTTHQLNVILRPDHTSWYTKMAYIFRSLSKRRIAISPKFELSKTTMYTLCT